MNAEDRIRREYENEVKTAEFRRLEACDSKVCNYDWNGLVQCTVGLKLERDERDQRGD